MLQRGREVVIHEGQGSPAARPRDASRMMEVLQDRLDELADRGLYRRLRRVGGPAGPHVVLDVRPVLLLCSNDYLGLAGDCASAMVPPMQLAGGAGCRIVATRVRESRPAR